MKRWRRPAALIVGAVLTGALAAGTAIGSPSYQVPLGARAVAMGGALWAVADEPGFGLGVPVTPWRGLRLWLADGSCVRLGDELLNLEVFSSLYDARVLVEAWRREYNGVRPHSSLGYRSPAA